MGDVFYRRVFFVGALWNVLGGALIFLFQEWIFGRQGLSIPRPPLYYYTWIALIETFGVGYLMVWRSLYSYRGIVILGMISKLLFSSVFIWYMIILRSEVPTLFWIPALGDLVFVTLFGMFLNRSRRVFNEKTARR